MRKGFTLIELLIVIAILAILSVVVLLVLNPAELLRQSRDSTRISDLGSLNSAIAFYLSDVTSPDLGTCSATIARVTAGTSTSPFTTRTSTTTVTSTAVNGTGWVDVNFAGISTGSPLPRLPIDPINDTTNFYAYACNDTGSLYEVNANMESSKFKKGGGSDVEINTKDGGDNDNWYEIGSSLTL